MFVAYLFLRKDRSSNLIARLQGLDPGVFFKCKSRLAHKIEV